MNSRLTKRVLWLASIGAACAGIAIVAIVARPYYNHAIEKLTGKVQFNADPYEAVKETVQGKEELPAKEKEEPAEVKFVTKEQAQNTLSIPTIGLDDVPVIFPSRNDYETIEDGLEMGVVHLANSDKPDAKAGVTYVIGHSSNFSWASGDYNYVFKDISTLEAGNTVKVQFGRKRYDYVVTEKKFLNFEEAIGMEFPEDKKVLVIMTCWPPNSSKSRVAIIAETQAK